MSSPTAIYALLQAAVTGFSILGGFMATYGGYLAAKAYHAGYAREEINLEVSRGIAVGFKPGAFWAALTAMIVIGNS